MIPVSEFDDLYAIHPERQADGLPSLVSHARYLKPVRRVALHRGGSDGGRAPLDARPAIHPLLDGRGVVLYDEGVVVAAAIRPARDAVTVVVSRTRDLLRIDADAQVQRRPADFRVLRQISKLPGGRFIKMSMHLQPGPVEGVPVASANAGSDPYIFTWGTGVYRSSDPYLSIVPSSQFESGMGTLYFAGTNPDGLPQWSTHEAEARPLFSNGHLGDLSVTWCADLQLWLMTYDNPDPHRIDFRFSPTPWGPWSDPQTLFDLTRDGLGKFVHRKNSNDGLAGPVIGKGTEDPEGVMGGAYAPYVVERWTSAAGSELSIYFVLSTWNPYVVVLMKSKLRIER